MKVDCIPADAVLAPEPIYEGKHLSEWLDEYERSIPRPEYDGDPQMQLRAEKAVRKIGENAIPWLLQELSAKEVTHGDEMPKNYYSGEAIKRRWLATHAFTILGSAAKSAAPKLVALLDDKQTSYTAAIALGGIGDESIPLLIESLANKNACARESAARVLGLFGAKAQSAIPALIKCTKDSDSSIRGFATFSLGQIGKEPDIVVPVLANNLQDQNRSTRINAVYALGRFGSKAKSTVPVLLKAMEENDSDFREIATRALQEIDPEAATKASVK